MSDVEYISYTTDEDTNPDGRARAFKVLAHFHDIRYNGYNGGSDKCQCYLAGLMFGWLIGGSIGIKDAEDLRDAFALLPPTDDIFKGIPFGHRDVSPDVLSLKEEEFLDEAWHGHWIAIRNDLYHFQLRDERMPERSIYSWLGFLRGALEANSISDLEYDRLRAMLPAVEDVFTPLVSSVA